ncbi:MAG: hypothetical protein IPL08_09815 [Saprospiraceae bacterium]|nr:hypothetical protein [Saprospiraceae bacterium]
MAARIWRRWIDIYGETGHTTPALFGSYINIPASAGGTGAPSPWTYANNLTSGVTTLTSTTSAVPVGNHSFVLQWKDYIYDCCGSSSATSNNECYERVTVRINIVAPLAVTSTSLACPPTTAGTVNVKSSCGITGGCTPVYSLFDNGVQVGSSNTSGVFNLPTTLTGPITVTVTSGCPTISGCPADCNNSQTITIDNACRQAPLCPTLVLGISTTTSGPKCPGDIVSLCVNTTTVQTFQTVVLSNGIWVPLRDLTLIPHHRLTSFALQILYLHPFHVPGSQVLS